MIRSKLMGFCAMLGLALSLQAQAKAKYVFFFIGDGMGVNQVNGTETYLASLEGEIGTRPLCFAGFPHSALVTTFSSSHGVTDSAAGGTALATGSKTCNGTLGLKSDLETEVVSLAEMAKEEGLAVGVATSVSVDHATPAAFYSHVKSRKMYHEIGLELISAGYDFYAGSDFLEPEGADGKDLYELCGDAGYAVVRGYDAYLEQEGADRVILLQPEAASDVDRTCLPYAVDRGEGDLSLADITRAGIDFLSRKSSEGFFLMVEGGKIDWAGHSNDAATLFAEVVDMDSAVRVAYDFYLEHADETIIVISADHETGGLVLGTGTYDLRLDVLGCQRHSAEVFSRMVAEAFGELGEGFTWDYVRGLLRDNFGFWGDVELSDEETAVLEGAYRDFCSGVAADRQTLYASENVIASAARLLMAKKAHVGWQSDGHSAGYVPVFAVGVGTEAFSGRIDNTEIPGIIARLAGYGAGSGSLSR